MFTIVKTVALAPIPSPRTMAAVIAKSECGAESGSHTSNLVACHRPAKCPGVAVTLLRLVDTPQRGPSGAAGLVSRQPPAAILVFEQHEVRGEFAFEAGLLAAGSNGVDKSPEESSEVTHYLASLVNSRLTRPAERCHRSI